MRIVVAAAAGLLLAGLAIVPVPPATAEPTDPALCDVPACVPGIASGVVLGAPCQNTTYYAFGVTSFGRVVFCGSPRRYAPRWFRSPEVRGIKDEGSSCSGHDYELAQAPDGLFLACVAKDGASRWVRGDVAA